MKQYLDLVNRALNEGTRKQSRTGVDTLSIFNHNYEVDLDEGFPLLTTKEVSWKNVLIEQLWFLSGDTNIRFLNKHKCNIWNNWADENGELGPIYPWQWRHWMFIDQIADAISDLKTNPNSRRIGVSAWNVADLHLMSLEPCHAMFFFNVQYKDGEPRLCLHLTQRSCDIALGLPYNLAGYAFLLSLIGQLTNIKPWKFAHSIIDAHIYTKKEDGSMSEYDHIPGLVKQLCRDQKPLPTLEISQDITTLKNVEEIIRIHDTEEILTLFQIKNYNPHKKINFKIAI